MSLYTVNGMPFAEMHKKSKWTWHALHPKTGATMCTAKSNAALLRKLKDLSTAELPKKEVKIKTPKKPKPQQKKAAPVKRVGSIKNLTLQLICDDVEDAEVISTVQEAFPESAFSSSHISWYRSTLYKDGIIGPEHAPRRSKAYKDWKQNN